MIVLREQNNYLVKFPQKKNDKAMKYSEIKTEQIKENLWVARTTLDPPLNCEVSIEGKTEAEALRKMKLILTED